MVSMSHHHEVKFIELQLTSINYLGVFVFCFFVSVKVTIKRKRKKLELKNLEHLAQCLATSKCSVNALTLS